MKEEDHVGDKTIKLVPTSGSEGHQQPSIGRAAWGERGGRGNKEKLLGENQKSQSVRSDSSKKGESKKKQRRQTNASQKKKKRKKGVDRTSPE